ncbi:uncharacterized protein LOC106980070 [Acinonyx jubatus]|uniref:Uncharacterized protein LOC106980070 n=1 Tax=Acinonyx jubatus TaxID=32536 RepID=A0A6J1Z8D5_ACIJB|nr:uncharacterized protein LOC106980070 [Acinonyx jubatus]XP_026913035.2 uncharacterized protein LOC106980070 [Acinonyx jubatus]
MGAVRRLGYVPAQRWGASQRRERRSGAGWQHLSYLCPGEGATRPGEEREERPETRERSSPGVGWTAASRISASPPAPSLFTCLRPLSPPPQPSRPETRRAPLRGSFGYPGGGNPSADWEARRSPAMLLTFCSSSRRRRRRRLGRHTASSSSSSSSASKRRFLQRREVLCQESSGRDWRGPCSLGSAAGARAQPFV